MQLRASPEWIENTSSGRRYWDVASELWAYRELAGFFAWRELKLRYKQAVLGVVWVVLQPLLGTALFTVLFANTVGVPSDGVDYAAFLYVGLAMWTALTTSVSRAAELLVEDPDLVTKVYFPRLLAPLGAVLPAAVDFAIAIAIGAPFLAAYGIDPQPALLLLPLCLLGLVLVALVAGLWFSALQVLYRDIRYAMPFALQVWLFASPVLYPASIIEGDARLLLFLNPAVGLLDATRACTLGTPFDASGFVISVATLAVVGLAGLAYFNHADGVFADRI
jgi:lipopolysaccharide transport system permease protein